MGGGGALPFPTQLLTTPYPHSRISGQENGGWWLAKLGAEEGWVPASYLRPLTAKESEVGGWVASKSRLLWCSFALILLITLCTLWYFQIYGCVQLLAGLEDLLTPAQQGAFLAAHRDLWCVPSLRFQSTEPPAPAISSSPRFRFLHTLSAYTSDWLETARRALKALSVRPGMVLTLVTTTEVPRPPPPPPPHQAPFLPFECCETSQPPSLVRSWQRPL